MVSIIVPVYNGQQYLKKCVDSLLTQTYQEIEIILINDGSKDDSLNIIREYEKAETKVRVYDQSNQGVAVTRNQGIQYAKGSYVMFVDNDDFVDVDYVEIFVKAMEEGDYDFVVGGYRRVNQNGEKFLETYFRDLDWSYFMFITPWARIFKKEFLIKNNISFLTTPMGEDIYFNIAAFYKAKGKTRKIIQYIGYNWYYNEISVSNKEHKKLGVSPFMMLDKLVEYNQESIIEDYDMYEYFFIKFMIWFLLYSGRKSRYHDLYEAYLNCFKWLQKNFPNYRRNKYVALFRPKGEHFSVTAYVTAFMVLHKMKLVKLFLRIYCKI